MRAMKLLGTAKYDIYILHRLKMLIIQLKDTDNLTPELFYAKGQKIINGINPNKDEVLSYNESDLQATKIQYIEILKNHTKFVISYLSNKEFSILDGEDFIKEIFLQNNEAHKNNKNVVLNIINSLSDVENNQHNTKNIFQTTLNNLSEKNLAEEIVTIDEETKKKLIELGKQWWTKYSKMYDKKTLIYLGGVFFNLGIIQTDDSKNRESILDTWSNIMNTSLYDHILFKDITYSATKSHKNSTLKHLNRVLLFFKEANFQVGIKYLEFIKSEINKK